MNIKIFSTNVPWQAIIWLLERVTPSDLFILRYTGKKPNEDTYRCLTRRMGKSQKQIGLDINLEVDPNVLTLIHNLKLLLNGYIIPGSDLYCKKADSRVARFRLLYGCMLKI